MGAGFGGCVVWFGLVESVVWFGLVWWKVWFGIQLWFHKKSGAVWEKRRKMAAGCGGCAIFLADVWRRDAIINLSSFLLAKLTLMDS